MSQRYRVEVLYRSAAGNPGAWRVTCEAGDEDEAVRKANPLVLNIRPGCSIEGGTVQLIEEAFPCI